MTEPYDTGSPYDEADVVHSGHPEEPTTAEAIDGRLQAAAAATRQAVAGGPLALVGLILGLVSFVIGEAGVSITVLRTSEDAGFGRIEAQSFSAVSASMAGVGLVAAIIAVLTTRGGPRTWRCDAAIAALILCALSAGMHSTLWVLSIYHHTAASRPNF
ncbi:MAG: hypothetical protein ACJ735_01045 [Actinomycetes bacterium]